MDKGNGIAVAQLKKWLHPELQGHIFKGIGSQDCVVVHPYAIFWCRNEEDCATVNKIYEATKSGVASVADPHDYPHG